MHILRGNWFALPLLTLSLTWAGCGDDNGGSSNPTGSGASSGSGAAITADNVAQVQTALGTALSAAAAAGPGTHDGAGGGQVTVEISIGKAAVQSVNMKMTFDGYSTDGQVFLDGTVSYQVSGTTVSYQGDLEFSGTYSGKVEIDITAGPAGASGTYQVNGQTITL